jgi:hypothetical protein
MATDGGWSSRAEKKAGANGEFPKANELFERQGIPHLRLPSSRK